MWIINVASIPYDTFHDIGAVHKILSQFVGLDIEEESIDISTSSMHYYRLWLVFPITLWSFVRDALYKDFPGRIDIASNGALDAGMFMVSVEFSAELFWNQVDIITFPELINQTSVSFAKDIMERVG